MNALLILNANAGTAGAQRDDISAEELSEAFAAAGAPVTHQPASPGGLEETFRAAIAQRPAVIFVGGGDGTISTAAGCLVDTRIALGVLPLGTLNHFAKDLGVPVEWRAAVTALADAPTRDIDVGEVNGRVFINNCSLGLYAEAVRKREALRRQRGHGKWWAMFLASCAVFRHLRRMRVRIETPEGELALRTPFVFVGNNRYNGHVLGPDLRERLDEGRLWLYTTRAHGHLAAIRLLLQSFRRRLDNVDHLESRPLTTATITAARGDTPVAADGELVALKFPLRLRIRPRALRVLAPVARPAT